MREIIDVAGRVPKNQVSSVAERGRARFKIHTTDRLWACLMEQTDASAGIRAGCLQFFPPRYDDDRGRRKGRWWSSPRRRTAALASRAESRMHHLLAGVDMLAIASDNHPPCPTV